MRTSVLTRAGRVLELIAARHAGKLPADVVAEVLNAAIQIQKFLQTEGVELANGELAGLSGFEAMRKNHKGTPIHIRQNSVGCVNDLHAPTIPPKRKRRKKQSN